MVSFGYGLNLFPEHYVRSLDMLWNLELFSPIPWREKNDSGHFFDPGVHFCFTLEILSPQTGKARPPQDLWG